MRTILDAAVEGYLRARRLSGGTRDGYFTTLRKWTEWGRGVPIEELRRHQKPWQLKDLRKTCATFYDEHVPESSVEILGHSVAGITYRHYADRAPLAFKAIMTIPQPSAFAAMVRGYDGECPCCRRRFADE